MSHVGAGEMHEDVVAAVVLNVTAEIERYVASATASAPGDVNPQRISLSHSLNTLKKVLGTCLSTRREVLE